jgi:hypothetical protein
MKTLQRVQGGEEFSSKLVDSSLDEEIESVLENDISEEEEEF